MLANIEKKSLLKVLVAGTCSAALSLAALTAEVRAGADVNLAGAATMASSPSSQELGNCLFAAQLASDPALKAAFTVKINAIRNGVEEESDNGSVIYTTNIDAGGVFRNATDPSQTLDRLSNDCLSCHDGVTATNFNLRIKNNPNGRVMTLEDIIGGHPVGMEYEKYVSVNGNNYRREVTFSTEMVFAEGKVGCLTCHNPLNSAKGHLVMANERSELCFACHNK